MACYVALGDSMSIDLYPEYDAKARLDRTETGLGAASLLFRNVDAVWPEHAGQDLATRYPGMVFENRTSDGAMIETVGDWQLRDPHLIGHATIVTLTVGGNDLLHALGLYSPSTVADLRGEVTRLHESYARLVEQLRTALPHALLVIGTIYDPTDGSGYLWSTTERLPIELLKQTNERIRAVARATPNAVLADVHTHFLGHGIHVSEADRWYWPPNPIEPSARGASEIRRVFWNAIG